MSEWETEQEVPRTREAEQVISVFLPDHFLYRGEVRTVVHFGGWCGGGVENTKDKS